MRMLWGVQYLRAIAALSVLLFHASVGTGRGDALGTGGVDVFFILSGFIMFEIAEGEPTPRRFILDRIRRIVPAYWIVTLLVAATQIAGLTENSSFSWVRLVKSLCFIPDLDPVKHQIYPVLIVGWTLNYEMFFYALMAALLVLPRVARLPSLAVIFTTLIAVGAIFPDSNVPLSFYSNPIIIEFLLGGALATAWRDKLLPKRGWPLIVVGALLMISPQPSALPRFIGYGLPAAMIVMGVLAEEAYRPVRKIRFPAMLGNASYSIYLWHVFFVTLCYRVFGVSPPIFALAVIGGTALGVLSYWTIERSTMWLLRGRPKPEVQNQA